MITPRSLVSQERHSNSEKLRSKFPEVRPPSPRRALLEGPRRRGVFRGRRRGGGGLVRCGHRVEGAALPAPGWAAPNCLRAAKCYGTVGTYGTCYDMATYPGIYVYDAPGINPSALWQLWSWNLIFLSWD